VASALNLLTCVLAALLLPESLGARARGTAAQDRAGLSAPEGPLSSDVPAPEPPIIPRTRRALASPLLPFYFVAFFVTFSMASLESIFPWFIKDSFGFGARDMGVMFLFMARPSSWSRVSSWPLDRGGGGGERPRERFC